MYQTHKTYIKPDMKMADIITENPSLMLLMEYFKIDDAINDKTIVQICKENQISLSVFLLFSNLYNGFYPIKEDINTIELDVSTIITFLKNSHLFYINDKLNTKESVHTLIHEFSHVLTLNKNQVKYIELKDELYISRLRNKCN
jgi:hypothetical protein